jgi:hypothetical protein
VALTQFVLAVFQKTGEGPVYVTEAEEAKVVGVNLLASPSPSP